MGEYSGRSGEVLARLEQLHPRLIDLSLERLEQLLTRLGNPERHLPPVIHVAGTNGKGSTVANMRSIAEAAGLRVHAMTSPHLLSLTERYYMAGNMGEPGHDVNENLLVETLEEIERVNAGAPITVFEVLTAAGFLMFSRVPADLVILEVGLGGRFDATNVIPPPLACALTSISLDHQAFLGETLGEIAFEKAGIIKPGVPVVSAPQKPEAAEVIAKRAKTLDAPLLRLAPAGQADVRWHVLPDGGLNYEDAHGTLTLPAPGLVGAHQRENAVLAIATLRASGLKLPETAYQAIAHTVWPARLQRLEGKLAQLLPEGWSLWVDGAHNPGGAEALAQQLQCWEDRPLHLVMGLKNTKDASGFLRPLLLLADSVQAVAEPNQHLAMAVPDILTATHAVTPEAKITAGWTLHEALEGLATREGQGAPGRVVICGSLYLAGCALGLDKN